MQWLWIVVVLIPIGLLADWLANDGVIEAMEDLIRSVFLGRDVDDTGIALAPSMKAEALCQPLTADILTRVRGCTAVRQGDVRVTGVHGLKMYLGVADLIVRYDFDGTDGAGAEVRVAETVFLRVKYDSVRSRFGFRSVTLTSAEIWQPTGKERDRLMRTVA